MKEHLLKFTAPYSKSFFRNFQNTLLYVLGVKYLLNYSSFKEHVVQVNMLVGDFHKLNGSHIIRFSAKFTFIAWHS